MPNSDTDVEVTESIRASTRRFIVLYAVLLAFLAILPNLIAIASTPVGKQYLGAQVNTDDHMVYAGWMRQAAEGHFFFENRFTTDEQPRLTIHLWFWLLGVISTVIGYLPTILLAKACTTFACVLLLGQLIRRATADIFVQKLSLFLATVGAGAGFLVWHDFGQTIVRPAPEALAGIMLSRLPIDVWQPEAFFFSSALTNGLFTVSVALILLTLLCVLEARTSAKAALFGAISFASLMNIHSYDVLIVIAGMIGLLLSSILNKQADPKWVLRACLIGFGALPPALWFIHVLRSDTVFQARAATLTYTGNFRMIFFAWVFFGILILLGALTRLSARRSLVVPTALALGLVATLFVTASEHLQAGYFLTPEQWSVAATVVLVCIALARTTNAAQNLLLAWALFAIVLPYFPGLFQRKLLMASAIPLGILAALAIGPVLLRLERSMRNLATTLIILLVSASSLRWFARELSLIRSDVSTTTVQPVFINADVSKIIEQLKPLGRNAVIAAPPGVPSAGLDSEGNRLPDVFESPLVPDLNPILVGLAGSRAYAGHWSETPAYEERRQALSDLFFKKDLSADERKQFATSIGLTHLIILSSADADVPDLRALGTPIYSGAQFSLIKL